MHARWEQRLCGAVAILTAVALALASGLLGATPAHAGPSAAAAQPTITDLGASVTPLGVNASQQVVFSNGSVWSHGTVMTPEAPASDPTAKFLPATGFQGTPPINDSGVVVGEAISTTGATVPAYWNPQNASFTEVSLAGLSVNGQPATGGFFGAIDAAGEAVGTVYNSSGSASDVSANTAGLFVAGNAAAPTGAAQVVSEVGGIAIHSLDGVSAGYEDANESDSDAYTEVLINRQTGSATNTNLNPVEGGPIGFADNGTLSGFVLGSGLPAVRTASGAETSLAEPLDESGPATDVNDNGIAVGYVDNETGPAMLTGLIWSAGGADSDLLSEASNSAGWSQLQPSAINDEGYVVGTGQLNGAAHGFLIATASVVPPVVTSTGDAGAANPMSGSCDTGQTVANALGQQVPECTLRAAIQAVDALGTSNQQITFDIPQADLAPIALGSPLPAITAPGTTVDASTETGGTVAIDATKLAGQGSCLTAQASGILIRGFSLENCPTGIELASPGGDTVAGDTIGLETDGETAAPGGTGVSIDPGSAGNLVGGATPADRNVISAQGLGINIGGGQNQVEGDLIGTDAAGTGFVPDEVGVLAQGAGNTIGGATGAPGAAPGNVIVSGDPISQFDFGVILGGSANTVAGNLIGTNAGGNDAYAPTSGHAATDDVLVVGPGDMVGGPAGEGNVIVGAAHAQVEVDGANTNGQVVGNQIGSGTDDEVLATPNAIGVLDAGAASAVIGKSGEGNAITGQKDGVEISSTTDEIDYTLAKVVDGITTYETYAIAGTDTAAKTTGASVADNVIGPLPGGEKAPSTAQQIGVLDLGGSDDTIGPRNVISFNGVGVELDHTDESGTEGNLIGTDAGGLDALPNGIGIRVLDDATKTPIGVSGTPDTISGNLLGVELDAGVTVVHGELVGMSSRGNELLKKYAGTLPSTIKDATAYLPNGGILVEGHAVATVIGGAERGDEVTVGGTDGSGIMVYAPTIMLRDRIGVAVHSNTELPNKDNGLKIDTADGDPILFADGIVAHSGGVGVRVLGRRDAMIVHTPIYDNAGGGLEIHSDDVPKAPKIIGAVNREFHGEPHAVITVDAGVPHGDFGDLELYASPSCAPHGAGERGIWIVSRLRSEDKQITIDAPTEPVGTAITALLTVTPSNNLVSELDLRTKPDGRTSTFSECTEVKPSQ